MLLSTIREGPETTCLISNKALTLDPARLHLDSAPQSMTTVFVMPLLIRILAGPPAKGSRVPLRDHVPNLERAFASQPRGHLREPFPELSISRVSLMSHRPVSALHVSL